MNMNVKYRVLGVMSGTSLDGIDFAICTFKKNQFWQCTIESSTTISYTKYWKKTLSNYFI